MTRDEILDAAAHIFSQKGYHAASMQDIAEAVKLQKASLYHHISSKQELLLALLDRALDLLIERMQGVVDLPDRPDIKLRYGIHVYLKTLLEQRDLASILLLEHRSLDPEYRLQHIPRRDRFESLWRDLLNEGKKKRVFICQDPALAARTILGVLNWTITWYRSDGMLSPSELADEYAGFFLNGLLSQEKLS